MVTVCMDGFMHALRLCTRLSLSEERRSPQPQQPTHKHSDCLAWLAWLFRALSRSLAKFMFVFENQVSKQPMDITKAVVQGEYLKQARRPHASIALARHACAVLCATAAAAAAGMDARVR